MISKHSSQRCLIDFKCVDIMFMEIDKIPDLKGPRYPERVTFLISTDASEKLKRLKERGKDVPAYVRKVLDEALARLEV